MNIERVRSFHDQRPIRPFVIHTTSGKSYLVKHPEKMAIGEEDKILILLAEPGKMAMIDLSSIEKIS